jgi:isoleucyl-tRNA synthetase
MTRLVSPILAFTSDEIWRSMKHRKSENTERVLYNDMPEPIDVNADEAFAARWDKIRQIRDDVKKALEISRKEKTIGASLDAKVVLYCDKDLYPFVKSMETKLPAVLIVSQVEAVEGGEGDFKGEELPGLSITVSHAEGEKCARCWSYSHTVGGDPAHPDVCTRCAAILK